MAARWQGLWAALLLAVPAVAPADDAPFELPAWAFPGYPDAPPPGTKYDDVTPLQVPGSSVGYTQAQLMDLFAAPDWFPDAHSPMPDVVARGRRPLTLACGYCHLPDGTGRPENAALAGLPADYIRAQVADMHDHLRTRAWAGPASSSGLMQQVAANATTAEVAAAAEYYSRLPMRRKVKIVETARVPRTRAVRFIYFVDEGAGDEPLGMRLIELPVDSWRHELRDPNVTYLAYVPLGSLADGEALATAGAGGRTIACVACHGADLRGAGVFPPLAGRYPSYLLRQLLAFRTGHRQSPASAAMQPVVAGMSLQDMIAVAAYAASLPP